MTTSVRMSCRSCRKSFGSQQSLESHVKNDHAKQRSKNRSPSPAAGAGHVRNHQERQCRGIKDPKNADSSSSSSSSSALDEFDLLKSSLPSSWAVTGKRGRKSTSSRATPDGEVRYEDKEAVQAAENLVWLSNSNPFRKLIHSPQIDDHGHDHDQEQRMMKGKGKLMELEEDQEPMNKNSSCNRHPCRICSKNFMSGRALGGHMSAHVTKHRSGSSSQASYPGETSNQAKKMVFGFDLNEVPPMEEDEEGGDANDDFCSCFTHDNPQQE